MQQMPLNYAVAAPPPPFAERNDAGRALRKVVPRREHAFWIPQIDRRDPVEVLIESTRHHLSHLLSIRYDRMAGSPFTFFQGSAAVMAMDLAHTPSSGLWVQACGDSHFLNFGVFADHNGKPIFDIIDFDETLPAPFEWDLKRLATSFVVAGRGRGLAKRACQHFARAAAAAYRVQMTALAAWDPLAIMRSHVNPTNILPCIGDVRLREREDSRVHALAEASHLHYPKLLERHKKKWRFRANQPCLVPLSSADDVYMIAARAAFSSYRRTLPEDQKHLLERYHLVDIMFKVAGIGTVGTFCALGLLVTADGMPLLVQISEARRSVLAPFARGSAHGNQGERIVTGQRIMQAIPDYFLGWTRDPGDDQHCYIRQANDPRLAPSDKVISDKAFEYYAQCCGAALASAHARSGDAACIAGYMGSGMRFDSAIGEFAVNYAVQVKRDWQLFVEAAKDGAIDTDELGGNEHKARSSTRRPMPPTQSECPQLLDSGT